MKKYLQLYNPSDKEILFLGDGERNSFNDKKIDNIQKSISMKNKSIIYVLTLNIIIPDYSIKNMKLHSTL